MSRTQNLEQHLARLNEIGIALSSERDLKSLLEKILQEAREFTRAEGGTLYSVEGDVLRFRVSQNDVLTRRAGGAGTSVWFADKRLPLTRDSMAGYVGVTGEVINLADAYDIAPDKPYRFNPEFDRQSNYRTRSMLMVPMPEPNGRIIGVLQLINARGSDGSIVAFDQRYEGLVKSLASQAAVAVRNVRLTEELKKAYFETILRLAVAVEFRDDDTADHIRRMARYSVVIAEELGYEAERIELLRYAAPMHDVGKVGISDAILLNPRRLSPAEYEDMQRHTLIGAEILGGSDSPVLATSAEIALTHHEKYDGTGYPRGLAGDDIPGDGRVVALADVFDALSSKRCYKPAYPMERCLEIIREERGGHFDPDVVDAFLRRIDDIPRIQASSLSLLPGEGQEEDSGGR